MYDFAITPSNAAVHAEFVAIATDRETGVKMYCFSDNREDALVSICEKVDNLNSHDE